MGQQREPFENWDAFLQNAAVGVHLVGADGTVLWANDKELEDLGYCSEDYIGQHISQFHIDKDVIERILNILAGGGQLNAYPARMRTKNGDIKHVLINSNVCRRDDEFQHTRCFTTVVSETVYNQLRVELTPASNE